MPRSPFCRTEACKASVTHPGPWEEFSKAQHGLISAQSFTQGCPRPALWLASLPHSAVSHLVTPLHVHDLFIWVVSLKCLAAVPHQQVGMSHAGQGSVSWEGGEAAVPCHQHP